jgi:predicted nucleic acid-binding Zn ribbon protein
MSKTLERLERGIWHTCRVCGGHMEQPAVGRKRKFCSDACKQENYRYNRRWRGLCAAAGQVLPRWWYCERWKAADAVING